MFCAAAVFAQPLHAEVTLDQTTKDFLEGMWAADGEPAHETLCAGKDAGGTQLGIEFTNSIRWVRPHKTKNTKEKRPNW